MGKLNRFVYYWFPLLIWMSIIFYFSSRLRVTVTGEVLFDFVFFKSLHIIEYAILYFLSFRAFYSINLPQDFRKSNKVSYKISSQIYFFSIILALIYACSDEFHQTFVPTREGRIRDVVIDSMGIFIMYIYIRSKIRFLQKYL